MQKPTCTTRQITLSGVTDIMFDRYAGDNSTTLRDDQKMYLDAENRLVMPALNLLSFLSAQNSRSACKVLLDLRKYKSVAFAILAYTSIEPFDVGFTRAGQPIVFGKFGEDGVDPLSGVYIHKGVARLKEGVPNPKSRPVLPTPWELSFSLNYFKNDAVTEEQIQNLFVRGGMAVGLGTFRPVFGKFVVEDWK